MGDFPGRLKILDRQMKDHLVRHCTGSHRRRKAGPIHQRRLDGSGGGSDVSSEMKNGALMPSTYGTAAVTVVISARKFHRNFADTVMAGGREYRDNDGEIIATFLRGVHQPRKERFVSDGVKACFVRHTQCP